MSYLFNWFVLNIKKWLLGLDIIKHGMACLSDINYIQINEFGLLKFDMIIKKFG